MKNDNIIFVREEIPFEERKISFYYNKVDDTVIISDSEYPNKKIEKKFSVRKDKCETIYYKIRINKKNGSIRKSYYISRETIFHLLNSNGISHTNRWNLTKYVFDKESIKNYLNVNYIQKKLQVPSFTLLGYSEKNSPEKAIYSFCYKNENRGSSTYYEILDEMGIIGDVVYRTHEGKTLRSYAEFVLFSFLHYNNIEFKYEDSNMDGCVPDFKLSNNTYIELVGYDKTSNSSHAIIYHERLSKKSEKYLKNDVNVFYLDITQNTNPKESVYNQLIELFPNLEIPNIFEYYEKYAFSGDKYVKHLKDLAYKFAKGELNSEKLSKHYQSDYLKILNEYGSVYNFCETFIPIDDLVNTPKSYGYFYSLENCFKWLDFLSEKNTQLPSDSECNFDSEFSSLYSIYRIYGVNEFCKGGLFSKYNTLYGNKPKEVYDVTNIKNNEKFNGIYEAYLHSNSSVDVGQFYDSINRKSGDFVVANKSGVRIKNLITNKVYQSIKECCDIENINYSSLETYLRKLRKGEVLKSKHSHLVPLTGNYIEIDVENYISKRYGNMAVYSDDEIKLIHNMIKGGKTESEITNSVNHKFSRCVFYKSLYYQIKIKELFNEEVNEQTINVLYPSKMFRTNFSTEELKQIVSLSFSVACDKFKISTPTYYNIKNKKGKYASIVY
jgi:hypothetical protein